MRLKSHIYDSFICKYQFFFITFFTGLIPRIIILLMIPLDWNWDSYHHWQISYFTLKIGFSQGRMWDLNGCEYYWGIVPHLAHALLLWVFSSPSIIFYRAFNVVLGGANTYLVYLIGKDHHSKKAGLFAAFLFGLFPTSVIFDTIAMQETLALSFALLSLLLIERHPVASGISLALASQSRIEYWLISMIIIVGLMITERFRKVFALAISWLSTMALFCWFFYSRTSNPIYPLYWSLYNSFGGWKIWSESDIIKLMSNWIVTKMIAWSTKTSGIVTLLLIASSICAFSYMIIKKSIRQQVRIYFFASLLVFTPLFMPYFLTNWISFLLMVRMAAPLIAFGGLLVASKIGFAFKARKTKFGAILIVVSTLPLYSYLLPVYSQFQEMPRGVFEAADQGMKFYKGGTIVSDYPVLNYRLISAWRIDPSKLISNHYSPAYYGLMDPIEFARWFEKHNVSMWIYANENANITWKTIDSNFPNLLLEVYSFENMRFYIVNRSILKEILDK